jgi:pyridoxamine 5'-phosphate oxidase
MLWSAKSLLKVLHKRFFIVSDTYFNSRPDGSKLGALVSNQSEVVSSRSYLEENLAFRTKKYEGPPIPRPENLGGVYYQTTGIEFWQGRANRLHDRIVYSLQNDCSWKIERLSP